MRRIVPFVMLMIVSGCATIVSGFRTSERVVVISRPGGCQIRGIGTTILPIPEGSPGGIYVPKGPDNVTLELNRMGYEPTITSVNSHLSGWVLGNLVFLGLIGLAVDFITCCAYDMDQTVVVQLQRDPNRNEVVADDAIDVFTDMATSATAEEHEAWKHQMARRPVGVFGLSSGRE